MIPIAFGSGALKLKNAYINSFPIVLCKNYYGRYTNYNTTCTLYLPIFIFFLSFNTKRMPEITIKVISMIGPFTRRRKHEEKKCEHDCMFYNILVQVLAYERCVYYRLIFTIFFIIEHSLFSDLKSFMKYGNLQSEF